MICFIRKRTDKSFLRFLKNWNSVNGPRNMPRIVPLPILLLLILGGIDLDIAAQAKQNLSYVVTASASCIDTPNCDPAALAQQNAAGLNLNAQYLTVTVNGKTVTGTYAYQPFSPFLPVLNLSATAVAP